MSPNLHSKDFCVVGVLDGKIDHHDLDLVKIIKGRKWSMQ